MVIKVIVPSATTPVLNGVFIATVYHNFFTFLSSRVNSLSSCKIVENLQNNFTVPDDVEKDQIFYCVPSVDSIVILPSAVNAKGIIFHIANQGMPNIFNITVMPADSETINGLSALTIVPGQSIAPVSLGGKWITLN